MYARTRCIAPQLSASERHSTLSLWQQGLAFCTELNAHVYSHANDKPHLGTYKGWSVYMCISIVTTKYVLRVRAYAVPFGAKNYTKVQLKHITMQQQRFCSYDQGKIATSAGNVYVSTYLCMAVACMDTYMHAHGAFACAVICAVHIE